MSNKTINHKVATWEPKEPPAPFREPSQWNQFILHPHLSPPLRPARHHGRGGAVLSGLRQDVPALLPLPALQRQRAAAVLLQYDRGCCVRDGLGAAAPLPPAPGTHHPAGPHTGREHTGWRRAGGSLFLSLFTHLYLNIQETNRGQQCVHVR